MGLLLAYVLYSLVPPGAWIPVPWGEGHFYLNTGQQWSHYVVPVAVLLALLILPSVGRVRALGVELEPRAPEPQATLELEPRMSRASSQQP